MRSATFNFLPLILKKTEFIVVESCYVIIAGYSSEDRKERGRVFCFQSYYVFQFTSGSSSAKKIFLRVFLNPLSKIQRNGAYIVEIEEHFRGTIYQNN